jgi:hypothetical protein
MPLKRAPQVPGSSPEFSHHFSQVSRELRQLFRAEDHQRHNENDDQVRNA